MLEALYEFGNVAVRYLAGPVDLRPEEHESVMHAAAKVVEEEPPLFKDDPDKLRTLSVVLAIGYREGGLRAKVHGDCTESKPGEKCKGRPRSFCTMQVNESIGGSDALNDDLKTCFRTGLRILRQSIHFCGMRAPIAWYAMGRDPNTTCESERGRRISNDRMALAQRTYRFAMARSRDRAIASARDDENTSRNRAPEVRP